ncbi:chromosome partitioning protein ParB [Clostridia bacterium]|nr:chromosome partitioning protein ParB [Clostridia bacterium]
MVKRGLGKGLGALITEAENRTSEETPLAQTAAQAEGLTEIDINKIEPNRKQPRRSFNEETLLELAESIKAHGILQPILVRPSGHGYAIVAGERRYRAARIAKLTVIPVIIKEYSDSDVLQAALIENLQRENLNPVEEAMGYKQLIDEFFLRQEDIAERVGKSRSAVAYCLSLLQLDPRVQGLISSGRLSPSLGKALLQIKDSDMQFHAAERIIEEELTVARADKLIKGVLSDTPVHRAYQPKPKNYGALEQDLHTILGTKVQIKEAINKESGKIEIEYYSHEELDRLLGILKRD